MRSQLRAFALCGIAEDPTCPSRNPSVTSPAPAMRRMVVAKLAAAAPVWWRAETTSKSSPLG